MVGNDHLKAQAKKWIQPVYTNKSCLEKPVPNMNKGKQKENNDKAGKETPHTFL